jgi:hypothetical protein
MSHDPFDLDEGREARAKAAFDATASEPDAGALARLLAQARAVPRQRRLAVRPRWLVPGGLLAAAALMFAALSSSDASLPGRSPEPLTAGEPVFEVLAAAAPEAAFEDGLAPDLAAALEDGLAADDLESLEDDELEALQAAYEAALGDS